MQTPQLNAPEETSRQLFGWMFGFVRPVTRQVVQACLVLSCFIGVEILIVRQTAEAINHIQKVRTHQEAQIGFWPWITSQDPDAIRLRGVVLVLGGLTVTLGGLIFLREISNMKMSMDMVFYIREAVYDKLQRVGFSFHDTISTGELINRALTDLQNVRAFVNSAVLTTLEILLIVGGYVALLLTRSPWVAALALAPLPVWTWYIMKFSRKAQPALKAVMESGDHNVSLITENIAGVHVVKAFATESLEIGKYNESCDDFFGRVMHRVRLFANFTPVVRSIAMASHLTLFLAAGVLIIQGKLFAGDILMLGAAMGAILGRLQQVATINEQYQNAIVSARRLREVLLAPPTVQEQPDAGPIPPGPAHVEFDNVSFGYDPRKPVLRDVSFRAEGGSIVAIVGPTGAGKTTLVNLLARFYDPQRGRILINGMDIREASLNSLRTEIAYVFQETYLFSDTVTANIAYGRPHIRGDEVRDASRLAQADEFVKDLPKGYDTVLGERGASLSGGQRQRLAIARAILQNPRILVLDDATAAIDPETEDMIRQGLTEARKQWTTFVIAHRISTVKRADLVIVLENGEVTQTGTHDQLMHADGHYRDIAAVQLFGDDVARDAAGDLLSHMDRVLDPRRISAAAAAVRPDDRPSEEEGRL